MRANAFVSKYERGVNTPSERTLVELARVLGVSPAWLRYGETGSSPGTVTAEPSPADREVAWAADAAGLQNRAAAALREVRELVGPMPRSELLSLAERLRANDPEEPR